MSKSLKKLIDINRLREFKNKLVGTGSAYVQTGAVDQTVAGTKTFSKPIVGSVTGSSGSCTGNAATATTATTATNATYTNWLRTSSHPDYLFHADWDGAYFWTYVNDPAGGYVGVRVARSDSSGSADTATNATNSNAANQLQAFVNDDFTSGNHYVKAIRSSQGWSTHLWMCYNNGAKMADEVSVNYANSAGSANTANTANSATTATKLATARTIALSGAATGTATGFDGSGNITIPVTALAASAIRAQWYAAYPDGAEAHNAMWGGRDITAAFNNGTVSANIANGTFRDIFPGDYITKSITVPPTLTIDSPKTYTVNWVIADCDYWWHKGDQNNGMETHHVVIVPQAPIFSEYMNNTNTTGGGYASSWMYRETILRCATGIVNAFGADHILTFRDGISNSVDTSHVSSGIPQFTGTPGWWGTWVSVQCNLMSEKMVYGAPICAAGAMDNTMATRQMSAFRLSERLINYNRQHWWLRDVVNSAAFAYVDGSGVAHASLASNVAGVRPFALLR